MAYVKLDTGILDSTLWVDREARDVFLTALLMAVPYELEQDTEALGIRAIAPLGFTVPAGWYGIVSAAGAGIVRRSGLDMETGLDALERLCQPDPESRTGDFGGRRIVRISGGFLVLNFMRYRDRDTTAAERMKRYRERKKHGKNGVRPERESTPVRDGVTVTRDTEQGCNVTQAASSKQEAVSRKQEAVAAVAATATPTADAGDSPTPAPLDLEALLTLDPQDPDDIGRAAYRHYRAAARVPAALDGQLRMLHGGAHGPGGQQVPWPILARALHDMQVAGALLTSKTLSAFAQRLMRDHAAAVAASAPLDDIALKYGI